MEIAFGNQAAIFNLSSWAIAALFSLAVARTVHFWWVGGFAESLFEWGDVAAINLNRMWMLTFFVMGFFSGPYSVAWGLGFFGLGHLLYFASARELGKFYRLGTAPAGPRITSGIYRLLPHPMYWGFASWMVGSVLLTGSSFLAGVGVAWITVLFHRAIVEEELLDGIDF